MIKRCPTCHRTYPDASLNFCLEDGTPLISDTPDLDPNATVRYPTPRDTVEPPPTEIYRQQVPLLNQVPEMIQPPPQWPPSAVPPKKKSNAVWWVLGGVALIGIIGIGLIVMILAIAATVADTNENSNTIANTNTNVRDVNRNGNRSSSNGNTGSGLPATFSDDFSDPNWGSGSSQFGDIWYADGEYHMRSRDKTYLVMYAPNNNYSTEDATVRATVRSVDGTASPSGFGLVVHGEKTKGNQLEDYVLLIYTGDEPQYEILMHKSGNQATLVPWTKSSIIRGGTSPNQLEARIKGTDISFYINGQYINRITDSQNFRRGVVGFYTSETTEVAFDDLEIKR